MDYQKDEFKIIGRDTKESEKIYKPSLTFWQDAWRRFKQNKIAMFFLFLIIFFMFMAIVGTHINQYKFMEQHLDMKSLTPSEGFKYKFYLGTDEFGRDQLTRLSQGIRVSLSLSLIVVSICIVFGTVYGCISAYFGGKVDFFMTRFIEIVMAIPSLIYIILLMVVLGNSLGTIIIAMALTRWLNYALLVRGEVLKLKQSEYVMASKSLGANFWWIIVKHLIPNTIGVIIVTLTTDIPQIIFTEAFLSFIGLGVPIPQASLGNLVKEGFSYVDSYPSLFIIPAVVISLITLSFNIVGDALKDALNPKLRNS